MHKSPQRKHHLRSSLRRVGALAVIGTLALAPALSALLPVEAAPPSHTRNRDGNRGNAATSLIGIVMRDYAGREFVLRLKNGRSVTVRVRRTESGRLSRGDRVEVRGSYQGRIFLARLVKILHNDDRRNRGRREVDFSGTVIRREGYSRMIVRADNRRNYTVTAGFSLARFDTNDRVQVEGVVDGNTIRALRVERLYDQRLHNR